MARLGEMLPPIVKRWNEKRAERRERVKRRAEYWNLYADELQNKMDQIETSHVTKEQYEERTGRKFEYVQLRRDDYIQGVDRRSFPEPMLRDGEIIRMSYDWMHESIYAQAVLVGADAVVEIREIGRNFPGYSVMRGIPLRRAEIENDMRSSVTVTEVRSPLPEPTTLFLPPPKES